MYREEQEARAPDCVVAKGLRERLQDGRRAKEDAQENDHVFNDDWQVGQEAKCAELRTACAEGDNYAREDSKVDHDD